MIFVTVGTHEQPFDRLVREVDQLKKQGIIEEEIFIQTGYCNYIPTCCEWKKMISYDEMKEKILNAHIVITHGGPASFIEPLKEGKIPIVVPRKKEFGEHVNDHQVEFVKMVYERQGNIIPVYDIKQIEKTIMEYENHTKNEDTKLISNNKEFNLAMEKIVGELFR